MKRAVVLLSGGLDSATVLFFAKSRGFCVHALIFDYGQRHKKEIASAKRIAKSAGCTCRIVKIGFPWKGSALLDKAIPVPQRRNLKAKDIPVTYVPARNIIFLSFAASYAETIGARKIFIGANVLDYSGYPDCRPGFFKAFSRALNKGSKSGVCGKRIAIETPLIYKTKGEIIKLGLRLGVPYALTWSCYQGGKKPCGVCDSCRLRAKGFKEIGKKDAAL